MLEKLKSLLLLPFNPQEFDFDKVMKIVNNNKEKEHLVKN